MRKGPFIVGVHQLLTVRSWIVDSEHRAGLPGCKVGSFSNYLRRNPSREDCDFKFMLSCGSMNLPDGGQAMGIELLGRPHYCGPERPIHIGHLASHETPDQYIFRFPDRGANRGR